jgi:hypothetical protein
MNPCRWLVISWAAIFPAVVPSARAQQNFPHIAYALPAGGQQGTTFQVTVGGQFLQNVLGVHISGRGIQGTAADYNRPMTPMQVRQLRDRLQELQKQPMDAGRQKEILEIRVKLLTFNINRNVNPGLAETVSLQITVAPDAELGKRELRLRTPQGLSNPLVFCIGPLPEVVEKESTSVAVQPGSNQPQISQASTEMDITLPCTVNGRIKPRLARSQVPVRPGQPLTAGDADRYRFRARRGLQLVVVVSARDLIPYLADAVPGWFQATIGLYNAEGKELGYDDDYRFHPDPILHYVIPEDGEYLIEIKDALYRGREDFIYRITLGELPFVTGIFPLGGRAGTRTSISLTGWNLPVAAMRMDAKDKKPGIHPISIGKGPLVSNGVPFLTDTLPELTEKEPNNSVENAQRVRLPIIVNGRISQPGDWDVFRFEGRAGDEVVAEVYARRLDSPLDSALKLTDAKGRLIAYNDDLEDKGSGLNTHHADSLIRAALPAKGTYFLFLGDGQQKSGAEYAYRLRISRPRPDFDLRIVPSSLNAIAGMSVPLTVYALRRDGFSGDIALALKGAAGGFILSGGLVPAQQDRVRLTLTVPPALLGETVSLSLEGRAMIQGQEIRRLAMPADDMMQAFAYHHLVPAQELRVAVRRGGAFRIPVTILGEHPVRIIAGETARIKIRMSTNNVQDKIQFELSDPPDGIALRQASPVQEGAEIELNSDAAKVKPGLKGNLIINMFVERQVAPAKGQVPVARRIPLGSLPAIPFEIYR